MGSTSNSSSGFGGSASKLSEISIRAPLSYDLQVAVETRALWRTAISSLRLSVRRT
jgi:hypothetical protein